MRLDGIRRLTGPRIGDDKRNADRAPSPRRASSSETTPEPSPRQLREECKLEYWAMFREPEQNQIWYSNPKDENECICPWEMPEGWTHYDTENTHWFWNERQRRKVVGVVISEKMDAEAIDSNNESRSRVIRPC